MPDSPKYWRSLEEAAGTPEFLEFLHREFPAGAAEWGDAFSRRDFLRLMGASLALAGVGACTRQPIEKIVPYVKQPEEVIPGKPLFFATAMPLGGYASGILVESHEGRPTKIEGNPAHPASLGATSIFGQAAILDLYDPDRSQAVAHEGEVSTWEAFVSRMNEALQEHKVDRGAGLRLLTETVTSPTLATQIQAFLQKFPAAKWHAYDALTRDAVRDGAFMAFGEDVETQYHFDNATVVLSLDSDFLFTHPNSLQYARHFADRRRVAAGGVEMNRLYCVEATPSITGSMADHRLPLRPGEVETFARALAAELGIAPRNGPNAYETWMAPLVRDLEAERGKSIVIAGDQQPAAVHALAHAMNQALGNVGATVGFTPPARVNTAAPLEELAADMTAGAVDTLVVLEGNPVFTAPCNLNLARAFDKVRLRVHLGSHEDETSAACHWHIPAAHFLETWSDARAFDGTVSILQPLIEPLYAGRSGHELLEVLLQAPHRAPYDIVHDFWTTQAPDFEKGFRKALHDGLIAGTQFQEKAVALRPFPETKPGPANADMDIVFRPDPTIWDGRFANNGWLQELAKPITKLTWENATLISPATAEKKQVRTGDVIKITCRGRELRAPVWIAVGHAEDCITLPLGYGREHAGRVGTGVGFNAYALRTSGALWFDSASAIVKTGERHSFAATQHHHSIEGRNIVRAGTLEHFRADPSFVTAMFEQPAPDETLYNQKEYEKPGYAWGMVIDLTTCIGCNACVIACQAENNIPVVGREQVAKGREMQWLRVDSYFSGDPANPEVSHQPVPCMHCENAPCELVCPVGATVHDDEGLNVQVYNRCIGTRYCSNNCPYKVRRFNFIELNAGLTPSEKLGKNPNVTVRSRGVMEKCTYCTQRITEARIAAEEGDRKIRDGEVVTACQAACPAAAITFGDIHDPESRVSKLKKHPLNYSMLGDLNTRPRTTYIAKLRNPAHG